MGQASQPCDLNRVIVTSCITPAPPQQATRVQGDTYDNTILARVVNKNPKI